MEIIVALAAIRNASKNFEKKYIVQRVQLCAWRNNEKEISVRVYL